jgi:RNA polymerase sigma-70 factor (ECF subfamily)
MGEPSPEPGQLQTWIDRLNAGDPAARDELLAHACDRLQRLTRKMLRGYERVRRWEQTDDVLQNALVRLWNALGQVRPRSVREFYGLAALQIRRELIDLARQYFGPQGLGANQASNAEADNPTGPAAAEADLADTTQEPGQLAVWSEFHQLVETLPWPEREVFDLLWYQEVTQAEAVRLLGVSEATVKRRWLSARRRLHQALKGDLPGV